MGLYDDIRILQHPDELRKIEAGRPQDCLPLHVRIEPSELCNFRCSFCWWHNPSKRTSLKHFNFSGSRLMDKKRLLALIEELAQLGAKAVSFTGTGDPLMYPHMSDVLDKVVENGILFGITSNMSMPISDHLIDLLAQASWVRWSMNAGSASIYLATANPKGNSPEQAFPRAQSNISRLLNKVRAKQSHKADVNASYVITQVNKHDIYEAARLASSLQVDSIAFRPDTPLARQPDPNLYAQDVVNQIDRAQEDFSGSGFQVHASMARQEDVCRQNDPDLLCFYSNHTIYIDPGFDVYPCCYTRYDRRYVFGNIAHTSLNRFWLEESRGNNYKKLQQDLCPACGYGRINSALKPHYRQEPGRPDLPGCKSCPDYFI